MFVILALLLSAIPASAATDWIMPLPDGLKVQIDPDIYVVEGEWTVLITIDEPQPPPELGRLVQRTRNAINFLKGDAAAYLQPYQADWHTRLRDIDKECATPQRWWRRRQETTRKRRGLINAIGSAMNYLFGVATDDQLDDLRDTIRELASNQQRLVNQFDQFTSVLNHTYDEIQANRHQINLISHKLRQLSAILHRDLSHVLQQVKLLALRVNFEVVISQLESISHTYVRSHEAWLHRRENLELGRLTENLLPPTVLRDILSSVESVQAYVIEPIEWYYEHTVITPIWVDNRLIYRTKLPVIAAQTWQHVQIWNWPTPVKDYQVTLSVPTSIIRNTETGEMDLSPACYGMRPRICRRGQIQAAGQYPCLSRLLSRTPGYDPECTVMLQSRLPHDVVQPFDEDSFILQTLGTELILRCSGETEQRRTIGPGVFEINIAYPCSLHGTNWTLASIFHRRSNITFEPAHLDVVLNMSLTSMVNMSLEMDPTAFNVQDLSPVDRRQIKVSDFLVPRLKIPKKSRILWHIFWLLIIVALVGAAVYIRRRYIQQKSAKKTPEIELEDMQQVGPAAATAKAASPVKPKRSTVFQFRANKSTA